MTLLPDAATIAGKVRDLPPLPHALAEVLAALRHEDLHLDRCAALIERGQALCGHTLRLANSPFYGLSGRVGTTRDAIQLLGLGTVATLMGSAVLATRFDAARCAGFDHGGFVRHAFAVSLAARELARHTQQDEDEAGLTGLMHDVGQLALASYFPNELSAALALARSADSTVWVAERGLLNLDHAEVGGIVARHWHFPAPMALAIEQHHLYERAALPGGSSLLSDTVHVADVIAHALNVGHDPDAQVPPVSVEAWHRLQLPRLPMLEIFGTVERGVEVMAGALKV